MVVEAREEELGVIAVIADIAAARGAREDGRVEPLVETPLTAGKDRVAALVASSAALAAAREVEPVGGAAADVRHLSGSEGGDALDLPAVEHLFGNRAMDNL